MILPIAAGAAASLVVLAAGGTPSFQVLTLAGVAAASFGTIALRASGERTSQDPTAWWTSLGFLAVLAAAAWDVGRGSTAELPPLRTAAGLAVIAAGVVVRGAAVRALGPRFSIQLRLREHHDLITSGPYARVRHPNYTGLLLVGLGTAIALGSPRAFLAVVLAWLPAVLVRVRREEAMMRARFGEEWERYRGRTARLVPGVF